MSDKKKPTRNWLKLNWKRYVPDLEDIKKRRGLAFLATNLTHPMIWSLNRHSVARATFFGIICAMIPFPVQMIFGAIFAGAFRANLPVIIGWVLTTNPLTIPFVFYIAYQLGAYIMGIPISADDVITPSWLWQHYKPILLGSTIMGVGGGAIGYFLVYFFWRRSVQKRWDSRKKKRLEKNH